MFARLASFFGLRKRGSDQVLLEDHTITLLTGTCSNSPHSERVRLRDLKPLTHYDVYACLSPDEMALRIEGTGLRKDQVLALVESRLPVEGVALLGFYVTESARQPTYAGGAD